MNEPKKIYWDSSIILSHLNRDGKAEQLPYIAAMVSEMDAGQWTVFTSVFSSPEVAFIEADLANNREFASEVDIDKMWAQYPKMRPILFSEDIAKVARGIKRWQMKNHITISKDVNMVDIIHLASAMDAKVAEIYSGEGGWSAFQRYVKIPILKPDARPLQRSLLPEEP